MTEQEEVTALLRSGAMRLGWQSARVIPTGELVVFHTGYGVSFRGPRAWQDAVAYTAGEREVTHDQSRFAPVG